MLYPDYRGWGGAWVRAPMSSISFTAVTPWVTANNLTGDSGCPIFWDGGGGVGLKTTVRFLDHQKM